MRKKKRHKKKPPVYYTLNGVRVIKFAAWLYCYRTLAAEFDRNFAKSLRNLSPNTPRPSYDELFIK